MPSRRPTEEEQQQSQIMQAIMQATSAATATQSSAGGAMPRRRGPCAVHRNEPRSAAETNPPEQKSEGKIEGLGDRRRKRAVSSPAHWDRAGLGFARAD